MNTKRLISALLGLTVLIVPIVIWWLQQAASTEPQSGMLSSQTTKRAPVLSSSQSLHWQARVEPQPHSVVDAHEETVERLALINDIVKHVPLTQDGQLLYNETTKNFLNTVYNTLANQPQEGITETDRLLLRQQLIAVFPDQLGEQTANLVDDYFDYRSVEQSILVPELNGPELQAMFEQTVQLRRAYLGQDIADQLFAEEEAMARYVIAERLLQDNSALNDQQKQQASESLQQAFIKDFKLVASEATQNAMAASQQKRDE